MKAPRSGGFHICDILDLNESSSIKQENGQPADISASNGNSSTNPSINSINSSLPGDPSTYYPEMGILGNPWTVSRDQFQSYGEF